MRLRPLLRPVLRPLLRLPTEDSRGFWPGMLFASGEQGFLFINDISTMYQDSAGTTPAALEQPLGLWLDSRFGAVRGADLCPEGSFPTGQGAWISATPTRANYDYSGGKLRITNADNGSAIGFGAASYPAVITANKWYEIALNVPTAGQSIVVSSSPVAPASGTTLLSTFSGGVGPKRVIVQAAASGAFFNVGVSTATPGHFVEFTAFTIREVPGNHATQPTSANRPTLKQDAKGNYYVHFNGTNQWMQTGSIDFSGTDKMTVLAGVTKLSDAAGAVLVEHGPTVATTAGTFAVVAPNGATATFAVSARGATATVNAISPATFAAPNSQVLSGAVDTAAPLVKLRLAGADSASSAVTVGGGAFSSNAVYVGARAGTSAFFNGDIYCLGARGALTADSLIAQAERWLAARQGLSL